jgi:hypothetical protein
MPDTAQAVPFWALVAKTFKGDDAQRPGHGRTVRTRPRRRALAVR